MKKYIKVRKACFLFFFLSKETRFLLNYLATYFILVCGVLFRFVAFMLKGEGRREVSEWRADSTKAIALSFEAPGLFQAILSRTPNSVWTQAPQQLPTANRKPTVSKAVEARQVPCGFLGHPSRFQRPPSSISHTRSLSGRAWGRTVMRPGFCQGQSLPAQLTWGFCLLL